MMKNKKIKKPSYTKLARTYSYGKETRPNYATIKEWKESDNPKLNARYEALCIGYLVQEHGFSYEKIALMLNKDSATPITLRGIGK